MVQLAEALTPVSIKAFTALAAKRLRAASSHLDALDATIGDGDHGTSIARLFAAADSKLPAEGSTSDLLSSFGTALLDAGTGASGVLYATFFITLGKCLADEAEVTLTPLATATTAAVNALCRRGDANLGDATMIDAAMPFAETLAKCAADGCDLSESLRRASNAAQAGATSTANLVPRRGRARGFGEAALGHEDPGAASFAIVSTCLAEVLAP